MTTMFESDVLLEKSNLKKFESIFGVELSKFSGNEIKRISDITLVDDNYEDFTPTHDHSFSFDWNNRLVCIVDAFKQSPNMKKIKSFCRKYNIIFIIHRAKDSFWNPPNSFMVSYWNKSAILKINDNRLLNLFNDDYYGIYYDFINNRINKSFGEL